MHTLHMIQCTLNPKAFMAFAREQGLDPGHDELDLGYVGHAWLKAAFGRLAPAPWRLLLPRQQNRAQPARILAYSDHRGEELADHLARFATPAAAAVCQPEAVLSKPLPNEWPAGRRYVFEALCCPVGRKARSRQEKDVFLLAADNDTGRNLERSEVYRSWFRERVAGSKGIRVTDLEVVGFRLGKVMRKGNGRPRARWQGIRPQVQFHGTLEDRDGATLLDLLRRGVGRHRAFGFGMLLLRAA